MKSLVPKRTAPPRQWVNLLPHFPTPLDVVEYGGTEYGRTEYGGLPVEPEYSLSVVLEYDSMSYANISQRVSGRDRGERTQWVLFGTRRPGLMAPVLVT